MAHSYCTEEVCICVFLCVLKADEGQPSGTRFTVQFNKVALELKNLMHPKKHFPHTVIREGSAVKLFRSYPQHQTGSQHLS